MVSTEETIVQIMKDNNCFGQENMITPEQLAQKCLEKGLSDSKEIETAIVSLVDQDVIDYEMDDNLQTNQLWLL